MSQAINVPGMSQLTQFYAYDPVNRLEIATENPTNPATPACPDDGSQWCQKFGYDAWGNRQIAARSHLGVSPLEPTSFGTNNRITGTGWGYDAAGNLTKNPLNETFAYDAENRQTAYCTQDPGGCPASPGTGRTLYSYDGEGRRVKKELPSGVATVYVHDASGQLAAEYSTQGSQTAVTKYLTADHLGSTRVITGASGQVLERRDYHAFGEEILVQGGSPRETVPGYTADAGVRQKFTGKERDGETGLDYFGARYLAAVQGRFTTSDMPLLAQGPSEPQSWNLYTYTANSPLKRIDPDGRNWFNIDGSWRWYAGTDVTAEGEPCEPGDEGCIHSDYTHLLVFEQTGTNIYGAALGSLTLYEQNRVVAMSPAFSGGAPDKGPIPEGTFNIRLDLRDRVDVSDLERTRGGDFKLRNFYGIQTIPPPREVGFDAQYEWGSIRVKLNEPRGERRDEFLGHYLHGKVREGDYTHGCICERSETILRLLLQLNAARTPKIPVWVRRP